MFQKCCTVLVSRRDGVVHCYSISKNMPLNSKFHLPDTETAIRVLNTSSRYLIVGTVDGSIFLLQFDPQVIRCPLNGCSLSNVVTMGHSDEISCINWVTLLEKQYMCVSGYDGFVRLYDIGFHQVFWSHVFKNICITCFYIVQKISTIIISYSGKISLFKFDVDNENMMIPMLEIDISQNNIMLMSGNDFDLDRNENIVLALSDEFTRLFVICITFRDFYPKCTYDVEFQGHSSRIASLRWSETPHDEYGYIINSISTNMESFYCNTFTL
ncbi:hypothetical protein A3Q56_07830 [Intoshia linei]|uniref:Uncharacterized protein n=1 Tax=Intoshia linei TaxID=1819745 RepID=A0A177ATA5_9BILA|nr:hypothetical protein A3Q56_07830 [Intoshia linei]